MEYNKQDVFFSIIIPIYNSELYLETCIDSILNQNFEDFELLLVDDGSTDNSGEIGNRYADNNKRIKIIHKENGGQGSARNVALKIAIGEYIMFIDSDDAIAAGTLQNHYNILSQNPDIDCLQFPIYHNYGTPEASIVKGKEFLYDKDYNFRRLLLEKGIISWIVCNKVIKREAIADLYFPENIVFEDNYFVLDLIERLNTVYITEKGLYHYYKRESSTTTSKASEKSERSTFKVLVYTLNKLKLPEEKHLFYKYLIRLINVHKSLKVNFEIRMEEFSQFKKHVKASELLKYEKDPKNILKIINYKYL